MNMLNGLNRRQRFWMGGSAAALLLVGFQVTAEPLSAAGDTIILQKDIGQDMGYGAKDTLPVKSDKPPGKLDRLAVIRFELGGAAGDIKGAVLRLNTNKPIEEPVTYLLHGALPGAGEDDMDEATFTAEGRDNAIDKSGNRLKEQLTTDADPDAKGIQPLASVSASAGDKAIVFKSAALDAFLNGQTDDDAALIIQAQMPEEKGGTGAVFFFAREAGAKGPMLGWGDDAAALEAGAASGGGAAAPGNSGDAPDAEPESAGPQRPDADIDPVTGRPLAAADTPNAGRLAPIHVDLGFEEEQGTLDLNAVRGGGTARYHFYTQDGWKYDMPAMGESIDPEFTTAHAHTGNRSLVLQAGPADADADDRDRVELRVMHGKSHPEPFQFGQDRWYGMSLMIDPESVAPRPGRWLHIHQLWQPSTVGQAARDAKWGIPQAMSVAPSKDGKTWNIHSVVKSDGRREQYDLGELTPGQWHTFVFNVMLSHSKDDIDGHFRVWIDGESRCDATVDVGNYPRTPADNDPPGFFAYDGMDVRFGLYRKRQTEMQRFYLDDVWFGSEPPAGFGELE